MWSVKRKKKANVDVFFSENLSKTKKQKTGSWLVSEKIQSIPAKLELYLTKQKDKLRAVPEQTIKLKKNKLLKILPGNIKKQQLLIKLQALLPSNITQEEILQALPSGGIKLK